MKIKLIFIISFSFFLFAHFGAKSQTYNMANGTISSCVGTFYDNGGSGVNYTNSQNITESFCASAGQIISMNFTSFNTEANYDYLYVYDGPNTSSPLISTFTGNLGAIGTIYSSGTCLTFRFVSDVSDVRAGWVANISCVTMAPCNYILTLNDAGCNGTGTSQFDGYLNGFYWYSTWLNSPWCRRNILMTGLITGDWLAFQYIWDGSAAIDNQNSFELKDGYGNIVSAGFIPSGISGDALNLSSITTTCLAPPATANYQEDCGWTQTICSNATFSGNSNGTGNHFELNLTNTGCLFGEHQSTWYFFQAQTAGNIAFSLSPTNGTDDYDFAIWNATSCPPSGPPIRCSWAGIAGNTGLGNSAVDLTESYNGDSWVANIAATAGQDYLMLIDNWSSSSSPYTLTWNLSGGASLDCTLLPVELIDFKSICNEDYVELKWSTATEKNNDFFTIEKSFDNKTWNFVKTVKGAGNSNLTMKYSITDNTVNNIDNIFYRLKQTDYNGTEKEIGQIITDCKFSDNINVFNPFGTNDLHINISGSIGDEANLIIVDCLGNVIYNNNIILETGNDFKTITLESESRGIYNVVLIKNNKTITKKIALIK